MSDLDVYYAGAEVSVALSYLGLIKDKATLDYIKNNSCTMFKHPNGRELSYLELLDFLPEEEVVKNKDVIKIEVAFDQNLTEDQIKNLLGDRKFYRILDSIESLTENEINLLFQLLKLKGKLDEDGERSNDS